MLKTGSRHSTRSTTTPQAEPFHVPSFGQQHDIKGLVGDSQEAGKAVGYICRYLTKSLAETYTDDDWP